MSTPFALVRAGCHSRVHACQVHKKKRAGIFRPRRVPLTAYYGMQWNLGILREPYRAITKLQGFLSPAAGGLRTKGQKEET